jgi:hypothetical protein
MNRAGIAGLLLVLAGVVAWALTRGDADMAAPTPEQVPNGAVASGTTNVGAPGEQRRPADLADAPTTFLEVTDARSQRPVPGAAVHRLTDGWLLVFTDEQGRCGVPLKQQEQLAVVADGYLLRLCPTQVGSTPERPQPVALEPDDCSHRVTFRFVRPDGGLAEEVFARLRPARPVPPVPDVTLPAAMRGATPERQRAWTEHVTIGTLQPGLGVHVQLGFRNAQFVHGLMGEDTVRFAEGGVFTVEAATREGFVAQQTFGVEPAAAAPVVVRLVAGNHVAGIVLGAATKNPIAGAHLAVEGGDPLRLDVATDERGRFRIGPLLGPTVTLVVRHGDHEELRQGPLASDAAGVQIVLQPLPQDTVRGCVRARPDQTPIADALVALVLPEGRGTPVRTAADGTFALRRAAPDAVQVAITARGYLAWRELVQPGAPFLEFDLWPASTDVRLQKRLTAVLSGVVVDERDRPVATIPVRLHPGMPDVPQGLPDRRVLDGALPPLPLVVTTGSDGTFTLETNLAGSGRLFVVDGNPVEDSAIALEVALGSRRAGLRLVTRRRS